MWDRIDPIIQPISRQVEESNPRMELRKDESENFSGRKKGSREAKQSSIPWEDITVVSVTGLRNFLQTLLGSANKSADGEQPEDQEQTTAPQPEHHEAANTYVSRATHAYQATGKAVHDKNIEEPAPITATESDITLGEDFTDIDLERIQNYITALAELERRGIEEITLRRTLSFLESIGEAIKELTN